MSYTFDCDNKIIQLNATSSLDMQDLYSRWKDEVLSTIAGCEQAMRVIKEPLSGSTFVGPYYFIMNDWRIRPNDTAHELIVEGTVVQDATSTLTPFKVDDLTAIVSIVREVAVNVQVIESGGGGLDEAELHTALDNYTNKDGYQANQDLTHAKLDKINKIIDNANGRRSKDLFRN